MSRFCRQCGADITHKRPNARHCSGACRAAASRERKQRWLLDEIERLSRLIVGLPEEKTLLARKVE